MAKADKNGVTVQEHLEQIERSTGRRPSDLDGPEFPDLADNVWGYFAALSSRRGYGMSGPLPITYESIFAWCNLYRVRLSLWEMEVIEALDSLWLRTMQEPKDG